MIIKNWKEIIEKNEDTIYAAIEEAYKEMFGCDRNFHTYIIINEDGEVFREEAYGNTRNLYNSDTLTVATVNAWDIEDEDFDSNVDENLVSVLTSDNLYENYYNEYVDEWNNDKTEEEFTEWFKNEYETLYEWFKNEYNETAKDNAMSDFDINEYDIYENVENEVE